MGQIKRTLVLLAAVTVFVTALAVPAQAGPESTFLSRINSSRANAGLAPLETYWDLTDDARAHSARMAAEGRIFHNPALSSVTGVWQALGENVGAGWDPNELHDSFMNSGAHRANILGNFNYVGIGTKTDDEGVLWVTVIFMRADEGLNGGGTTTTTVPPTTTTTTAAPVPDPPPSDPPPGDPPPSDPPPDPAPSTDPAPETSAQPKSAASSTNAAVTVLIVGYGHPDGAIVD